MLPGRYSTLVYSSLARPPSSPQAREGCLPKSLVPLFPAQDIQSISLREDYWLADDVTSLLSDRHSRDSPVLLCVMFTVKVSRGSSHKNWDLPSDQWCGLRPSVLGQDWSETKKSVLVLVLQAVALVLVLHTAVLVLQFWCCFVKHDLVTLSS